MSGVSPASGTANSKPPPRHSAAPLVAAGTTDKSYAVTPHFLASEVALAVIERGGNAADAAIAANAVLGVVAPDTCGVGGDMFALVHNPGDSRPAVLNASGKAGSGVDAAAMRLSTAHMPLRHPSTITVPGCVAGWHALSNRYGTLPLADVIQPAVYIATNGFAISDELADTLNRVQKLIRLQPSAAALYPDGEVPAAGTVIRRPRLARTLQDLSRDGQEAFYQGAPGAGIVEATGGEVTSTDLQTVAADWVAPAGIDLFGMTAWTVPPNSQGYLTLAALKIFEQLEPPTDPNSADFIHAAVEAYRAVAWERDELVSDPDSAPKTPDELLSEDRLLARSRLVTMGRTTPWPQPSDSPGGTAYLCVRDHNGMGVSLIQSNFHGIGSGLSAGDTGVFLHNRGAGFNLTPGHPNELMAGRRPLHTLAPTMWTLEGNLRLLLGTRGGQYQPQLLVQVAAAILHSDIPRSAVQTLPRWQLDGWGPSQSPVLRVEERLDGSVCADLERRLHNIVPAPNWNSSWGPVSLIRVTDSDVFAAADPRVGTATAVLG